MKTAEQANLAKPNESLVVDISDALSERDRVRFTVHTKTKLPQFAKPVLSVVRQHEEFVWLHDCLVDNEQYAGYIIPPVPPKPDFDASRERLQQLGDRESQMTKDEFAKMKQELEAEYLAIFKKTVAMHEIFLQRLAAHEKFRLDPNFKIFLEYENELSVRSKSAKEKLAGSIQNIGKSLTDFVITTSQVAASASSSGNSILSSSATTNSLDTLGHHQAQRRFSHANSSTAATSNQNGNNTNVRNSDILSPNVSDQYVSSGTAVDSTTASSTIANSNDTNNNTGARQQDDNPIDEQYFEKERLFLALYYNSIRETAIQADRVSQVQKCVATCYLNLAQNLIKLAGIELVPIASKTNSSALESDQAGLSTSNDVLPLPSSTPSTSSGASSCLPPLSTQLSDYNNSVSSDKEATNSLSKRAGPSSGTTELKLKLDNDEHDLLSIVQAPAKTAGQITGDTSGGEDTGISSNNVTSSSKQSDTSGGQRPATSGCANDHSSAGLKQTLLRLSDYFEQAKKIETRVASDEDLKLTDTFVYYKHDTVAAQDLLMRRLRFMADYEQATRNFEKARLKGGTQMQYADVIQRQARENFVNISKLAKQELEEYKRRRVAAFKKSFRDLAELQLKHLRAHAQLIGNCLDACRGQ